MVFMTISFDVLSSHKHCLNLMNTVWPWVMLSRMFVELSLDNNSVWFIRSILFRAAGQDLCGVHFQSLNDTIMDHQS